MGARACGSGRGKIEAGAGRREQECRPKPVLRPTHDDCGKEGRSYD